jgi:hypothetical protein
MLIEKFGLIDVKPFKDAAIILDASESAAESREIIVETARQLIEKLPSGSIKGLYFLSNGKNYEANKLTRNSAVWWEQNRLRGSFLTPVLEQIPESMAVVIGSGIIHDLEDWQDSRWKSNLKFFKVKDTLRGESRIGDEFQEISQVVSLFHDPIISIEISGIGFMPFFWNNPEYKLTFSGVVKLNGSNLDNPAVSLGYFGNEMKVLVVRKSGEEEILTLKPTDSQIQSPWKWLPDDEAGIFHHAAKGEDFNCLICGQQHPASRIRCDSNSILGEPVYPSLGKKRGFVLFKEKGNQVQYSFHPVNAIKMADCSVAVSLDGKTAWIYQFDQSGNKWREKINFVNYLTSGDRRVVLL